MARIDEIRNWLAGSGGNRDEVTNHIYRLEVENEAVRRRNGDLMLALQDADPVAAASLVSPASFPTRHVVLDRILTLAAEYVIDPSDDDVLDELREAVQMNEGYWVAANEARSARQEARRKGWEKRAS